MAINVNDLLNSFKKELGKKYVFGAAGPSTFDCSGLVMYVFKQFGVNLPHHAEDQAKYGTAVSKSDIQPGDLVFSNWGDGPNSHVGIAVDKGKIIDAPHTGSVVRYDTLSSGYLDHVTAVRRMSGVTGTTAPSSSGSSGGIIGAVTDPFGTVEKAIDTATAPLKEVGKVADWIYKLSLPTTMMRMASGFFGFIFLCWGVVLLAKEVRTR